MRYEKIDTISDKFRVVVSSEFTLNEEDGKQIMGALSYIARSELRMPEDFTRNYEIQYLGNVVVIDATFNLRESRSQQGVLTHSSEYFKKVTERILNYVSGDAIINFMGAVPIHQYTLVVESGSSKEVLERWLENNKVTVLSIK